MSFQESVSERETIAVTKIVKDVVEAFHAFGSSFTDISTKSGRPSTSKFVTITLLHTIQFAKQ